MSREKLIRDLIPELAVDRGQAPMKVRRASQEEMPLFLLAKLREETDELSRAQDGDIILELADILEVTFAMAAWFGYDRGDLREIARQKAEQRGGFNRRLVWEEES